MKKILFVDDDQVLLELAKLMLVSLGRACVALNSGPAALEAFKKEPNAFGLVITDLNMPHLNGYELARKIRDIRADVPLILCTGDETCLLSRTARQNGIWDFLPKPLTMIALGDIVSRHLGAPDDCRRVP